LLREAEDLLVSCDDDHWARLGSGSLIWMARADIKGFNPPQVLSSGFKYEDLWLDR
jgi:hypothetical protein